LWPRFDLITQQPYFSRMINVTESAARQLQSLLSQRTENSRRGLRVQVTKGGCSGLHYEMALDEKKEGDAVVERNGMQFFIDGDSIAHLRGATLDFSDGLTGTGFRVVNPNASRTCGCGSSFETTQSS
jgi:iron-sulfur cluster assembly protein